MFVIIIMCVGDSFFVFSGYYFVNKSLIRREGFVIIGGKLFIKRIRFFFMFFENGIVYRR